MESIFRSRDAGGGGRNVAARWRSSPGAAMPEHSSVGGTTQWRTLHGQDAIRWSPSGSVELKPLQECHELLMFLHHQVPALNIAGYDGPWITGQLLPYQQAKWGMGCSGQGWSPASTSPPLSKVSVSPGERGGDALLTIKLTHSAFHRCCFYRTTLAWPCQGQRDNPPKVGLETLKLYHRPRNGFIAGPVHFSTTSPR